MPTTRELAPLITELRSLILSARHAAATTVNSLQVLTNFEIGRCIVEHEQKGEKRKFYLTYQDRPAAIFQKTSDQLAAIRIFQKPSEKSPFTLSWPHYVLLLTIKNPEERNFYEIESAQAGWSQPELKRQVSSCRYERLALSRDKEDVRQLANEGQIIVKLEDRTCTKLFHEYLNHDFFAANYGGGQIIAGLRAIPYEESVVEAE